MSVYKEAFSALSVIAGNSVRIFSDACDFGAPTRKGDEVWVAAGVLAEYSKEKTNVSKYATGQSASKIVTVVDEWAVLDERKTIEKATETYLLAYTECHYGKCKGMDGYISVTKI